MRRRAFTLVEILICLAIAGMLAVVGFGSYTRARGQAGAQGLAQAMADVFRQARQEAITRRRPVAVMLPSAGGTLGSTSAFYLLEGETLPQVTRVRSFGGEYKGVQLFVGQWSLLPSLAPTLTTTVAMPGSKWSTFNLNNWLPPAYQNDYAFCYLPDGTLRCNGLANFEGNYHVAVCTGLSCTGGAGNFTLTQAGSTFTLSLSPAGAVALESGLRGQDGSIATRGSLGAAATAPAPPVSSTALADPVMLGEPQILPPPDPDVLPPGINATLTRDQFLSLSTQAISPSGHPLYCRWQVAPPVPPAGPGSYSFPGNGGRMTWDPKAQGGSGAWTTTWQWRPPPTASPNDVYRLQCVVQNYGGTPVLAQIKEVKVIPPGRVFFETNRSGAPEIWSMNEDGSRQRVYIPGAHHPTANLDGTRLAYVKNADQNLYLVHPEDPGKEIQLTFNGGYSVPALSPNGNRLAFRRQNGANYGLHVMKVSATGCASNVTIETDSPLPTPWIRPGTERLGWSKDGTGLLYTKADGSVYKADIGNGGGGNPTFSGPAPAYMNTQPSGENPVWNPSWGVNDRIYYSINKTSLGGTYDPYIFYKVAGPGPLTGWNWGRDSYSLEEIMCERDPAGGDHILATEQPVPIGADESRIVKIDTTVPMGFTLGPAPRVQLTHTPGAYNTRPCWTK